MSEINRKQGVINLLRNKMNGTLYPSTDEPMSPEEYEFFENHFLIPMEKTTEEKKYSSLESLATTCLGGYAVGFMPSECYRSLVKIGDILAGDWAKETSDQNNLGEKWFWRVCFLLGLWSLLLPDNIVGSFSHSSMPESTKNIIELLDNALEDVLLPRKMFVAALQVKITYNISQAEYDEALSTLVSLEEYLNTVRGKENTIRFMGYTTALMDYDMHVELDRLIQIDIPEEEYLEDLPVPLEPTSNVLQKRTSLEIAIELTKRGAELTAEKVIESQNEPFSKLMMMLQGMSQKIDETNQKISPDYEKFGEELKCKYDWINSLTNCSALVNGEYIFEALNKRSWGEAVTGYCNAAEAEIRNKIAQPLHKYLLDKYQSNRLLLTSQAFSIEVTDDMSLKDVQTIFSRGNTNPKVTGFLNLFDPKSKDIISKELSGIIENIRKYRNETPSTHGSIVTSAKDVRQFVLGTPDKPGILKKLAELPKVS